jgi:hypothetical protein
VTAYITPAHHLLLAYKDATWRGATESWAAALA